MSMPWLRSSDATSLPGGLAGKAESQETFRPRRAMQASVFDSLPPRQPIAIIRLDDLTEALQISRALQVGGITRLEFTLTNAHALAALGEVRREFGDGLVVGVGTVLDGDMAASSIEAGAQFLVTPTLVPDVIVVAKDRDVPIACGAFTPTEILTAWRLGADL